MRLSGRYRRHIYLCDNTQSPCCDQDEVALELNKAVLHSYKMAGVTIVDHFTQADQVSKSVIWCLIHIRYSFDLLYETMR